MNKVAEILVYTDGGLGASHSCVKLAIDGITQALSTLSISNATINTTTSTDICQGCLVNDRTKLLVMPGGRDLPFCQKLNGLGNTCIRKFIESGGSYLGLCAGGYYACESLEFSKGHPDYEICDERELKLYPGTAIGPVYPGFVYTSNEGARPVTIKTLNDVENFKGHFTQWQSQDIQVYFNGGPYFTYPDPFHKAAKVLACYSAGEPAIVQNIIGNKGGCVILCGPHIEASPTSLRAAYKDDLYIERLVSSIETTDALRNAFFTSIIENLLGLVNY